MSNVCYEVSECVFYSFYLTHFFLFVLFSPYSFLFYLILLFEIPICVIVIEFFFKKKGDMNFGKKGGSEQSYDRENHNEIIGSKKLLPMKEKIIPPFF